MSKTRNHSFGKEEHLYGKSAVSTLLDKGRWGAYGPLKFCYLIKRDSVARGFEPDHKDEDVTEREAEGEHKDEWQGLDAAEGGTERETECRDEQEDERRDERGAECRAISDDGMNAGITESGEVKPLGQKRIMVAVPKKFFKRAVKRNLLKRRLREAYRSQKHLLEEVPGISCDLFLLYNTKELLAYSEIRSSVAGVLAAVSVKMKSKCARQSESK